MGSKIEFGPTETRGSGNALGSVAKAGAFGTLDHGVRRVDTRTREKVWRQTRESVPVHDSLSPVRLPASYIDGDAA